MTIEYARGTGTYDARPVNVTADSFEAFVTAILADRGNAKGQQYICATMADGHRCKASALPRRWIGLDMDGATTEAFASLLMALSNYSALLYHTASSTPDCPRARIVVELAAPADRESARATAIAFRKSLGVRGLEWDTSCDKAEQPLFLPLIGAKHCVFTGKPLIPSPAITMPVVKLPTLSAPVMTTDQFARLAAQTDLQRRCAKVAATKEGNRNNELAAAAYACGGDIANGLIEHGEVEAALLQATLAWGPHDTHTLATLRNQLKAGADNPKPQAVRAVEGVIMPALACSPSTGAPYANTDNAARILRSHPRYAGNLWFDTFKQQVIGPDGPWTDQHDVALLVAIQSTQGIPRMAIQAVQQAVGIVARENSRSSARDWMESLPAWDGVKRMGQLFPVGFGADDEAYQQAVGMSFLISMVARVYQPGCKVDTMPVLEGRQGAGKSTGLRKLVGDAWFAEASHSPTDKDFYLALHGKLLIEIAELDAFNRADTTAVKRVVTTTSDRYRSPYGRESQDHPRQCVFAATTNSDDWNKDTTGARRFLPIICRGVDIEWIEANREQLFAEAVAAYKRGAEWWDVPTWMARPEQEARAESDPWDDAVLAYAATRPAGFTVGDVLMFALQISRERWDKRAEMRVANILRRSKFSKSQRMISGRKAVWWQGVEGVE